MDITWPRAKPVESVKMFRLMILYDFRIIETPLVVQGLRLYTQCRGLGFSPWLGN